MGYPARVTAVFDVPEDELVSFEIWTDYDGNWDVDIWECEDEALIEERFERVFREVMETYREMGNLFGAPTGGRMRITKRWEPTGPSETSTYTYPIRSGLLDEALLVKAFFDKHVTEGELITTYDNVTVRMVVSFFRSPRQCRHEIRLGCLPTA